MVFWARQTGIALGTLRLPLAAVGQLLTLGALQYHVALSPVKGSSLGANGEWPI